MALTKNYGMLPWWTPDDLKLGLCRPVDRVHPLARLPALSRFARADARPKILRGSRSSCFSSRLIYRKLMGAGWAAGLAALLFLLDGNTYFPVMFVANRGFIMSLFFGLLCLYEHHQWRSTKSRSALALSALFLALSLFSKEGGASTFAFILAYALVLEPGSFRSRALTVLPSILVIIVWRTVYILSGFGLFHVGLFYIDPAERAASVYAGIDSPDDGLCSAASLPACRRNFCSRLNLRCIQRSLRFMACSWLRLW